MIEHTDGLENTLVPTNESVSIMSTHDYYECTNAINKLKISDLRNIIKHYKKGIYDHCERFVTKSQKNAHKQLCNRIHDFALVGNKSVLLERVVQFFRQDFVVGRIQRVVRGYFVRLANKLRGPAMKNRDVCKNASDFCTLEPLAEIHVMNFYSYTTNDQFTYGFDIDSLMNFIRKRGRFENPYTRENMIQYIPHIKKLFRLNRLNSPFKQPTKTEPHIPPPHIAEPQTYTQTTRRQVNSIVLPDTYNSAEMTEHMREIRTGSVESRIHNLFMEIDHLGNYTDSNWFSRLERSEYIRCFRLLRDIWNYRSRLSFHIKLRICPLWDPFIGINGNYAEMNYIQSRNMCLTVMEDLVYMGVDTDAKTLGSFQVLTSLTFVSIQAREALPWLYESIF